MTEHTHLVIYLGLWIIFGGISAAFLLLVIWSWSCVAYQFLMEQWFRRKHRMATPVDRRAVRDHYRDERGVHR
jgi:hypothetical protein